ncbi:GDP-mannose 4,6-dehydratase [Candidatus Haliotispira prima]|uniref:GDP-mannose 4,6-dehydratase n=1 Tax=Candidatus Haliotispira prima TaxID=3034016 RepID=A0ABY8MGW3_9SPIO|nr:GDP-mannose 4,6-dehydratase [Candidatus Haliotispira prima]
MGKILITGVSGFIGFHTAKELLEKEQQIIGIDNINNSYDITLKKYRLSKLKQFKNFTFYKQDIAHFDELEKIFSQNKIFKIIHLAGKAGVRKSLEEPQEYINSNILGTVNLLELSKDYKISNFINASSSSIYTENKIPFVENSCINKISSPYGVTKRATELFTYSYHLNYKLNIINFRFFTVYGNIGRPDMSVFKFIKLIDNNKPIHIFGDGEQTRSFTFVNDIVDGIIKALELTGFDTINLGNNKKYSLNYLIKRIEEGLNKKAKIIYENINSLDMLDTLPQIQKANELLNWKPIIDLDKGISKTVNWHIENRDLVNKVNL